MYVSPTLSDINECALDLDGCDHNCTNTEGSFVCSCRDGFFLDEDERSCSGEKDMEETTERKRECEVHSTPALSLPLSVPSVWL